MEKTLQTSQLFIKLSVTECAALSLDAVFWTNLNSKFNNRDVAPTLDQAITHLHGLNINSRQRAEEYIRRTPAQIGTPFREEFEVKWG